MNVDWFFRIPYDVRVLAILLALAFGLVVSCRPLVEWYRCGGLLLMSGSVPAREGPVVWAGFGRALRALSPKWTPDGAHIVFVAEGARKEFSRDERKIMSQMHVVGVDGSNLRTISDGSREFVRDHSPSVSPDGTRVAYSEYNRVNDNKRYEEIVTTALDGSERRRLTHKVGLDRASYWLPDSDRIAFRRVSTGSCASRDPSIGGIYTIGSNRSDFWRITWDEDEHFPYGGDHYAWSPYGRQLAIIERLGRPVEGSYSQAVLDVMDADGSNRRPLIDGKEWLSWPAWSQDGARIAFMTHYYDYNDDFKGSLLTVDLDSGELSKVVDLPIEGALSWSPDGSQIMVSNGRGIVYLVQADGSDLSLFSDIDVFEFRDGLYAAWSPDGSRVAVVMPGGSGAVLATVAPDGSDARVLARRGEDGALEAVGSGQHGDGPIDVITCARTKYLAHCLQVVNDRLVSSVGCTAGFVEQVAAWSPGLASDCEALWALGRWATEVRQPDQFDQTSWDRRTPISEWKGVVVGDTSTGLRVVGLSLEGWNLSGSISGRLATELAKLTALESLDLSGNRLSGWRACATMRAEARLATGGPK